MDGLARVAGGAVPIEFDGRTLLLSPLVLRDFATIEQHLLKKRPNLLVQASEAGRLITNDAKRAVGEIPLDDPDRTAKAQELLEEARGQAQAVLNTAAAQAAKINKISSEEVAQWIDTPEGMAFCFWLKFQKDYPGQYTLERLTEIFNGMADEAMENMVRWRDQAAGTDLLGNSTGPSQTTTMPEGQPTGAASSGN